MAPSELRSPERSRWELARDQFLDLAELPTMHRKGALEALAGRDPSLGARVAGLLEHDRPADLPDAPMPDAPLPGAPRPGAPRRFGPYEVVRPLGAGGMGEVFVARRADGEYEREVAVKLLRFGASDPELVQRFLRERQTLARLDHEYVARLLDGGTTEAGQPYLVMEYVEGEPADRFAARLGLSARLELFARICRAVAHAHERGFVHRDLKPGNVLVRPDGTPRLLDFGIARTTAPTDSAEALTRTGRRLYTPRYASPEQVREEPATERSDVFALGVLLHVFLCGRDPWPEDADPLQLELAVAEHEPLPPSRRLRRTARARVAGDLDAITLQCLAKRPERRYASVAELGADVERHLAGLPIRARRTGPLGRALRLARRQPAWPVGLALLVLLCVGGWNERSSGLRDRRWRDELAASVADRIETSEARWADGERERAEAELDAALAALEELPDDAAARALRAGVLARQAVYANLRREWSAGLALVARAEELIEDAPTPDPELRGTLLNTRAYALLRTEPGAASRAAAARALAHARARLPRGDVLRVDALLGWADELRQSGDEAGASAALDEALAETRARDPRGEVVSRLLNERAVHQAAAGRLEQAAESYAEALEILSWHRGERHPGFFKIRLNLGATLFRLGRLDEAEAELERALSACRELGEESFAASCLHFLGRVHCARGELEPAEAAAREALAIRARQPDLHADRSRCLLGIVLARSGRADEARAELLPLLSDVRPGHFLPEMELEARQLLAGLLEADDPRAASAQRARAAELEPR